jgi:hypothetical protein
MAATADGLCGRMPVAGNQRAGLQQKKAGESQGRKGKNMDATGV